MNSSSISAAVVILVIWSGTAADEIVSGVEAVGDCPVTLGPDGPLEPGSRYMYGSDTFGVSLPADGTWPITAPNARIAVKLFWRSAGYRPGMEQHLQIDIENLGGGPNDAVVKAITSANSVPEDFDVAEFDDKWQEGWLMLAGMDFPSPGCWEITGKYLDQSLMFVVQTIATVEDQTRAK